MQQSSWFLRCIAATCVLLIVYVYRFRQGSPRIFFLWLRDLSLLYIRKLSIVLVTACYVLHMGFRQASPKIGAASMKSLSIVIYQRTGWIRTILSAMLAVVIAGKPVLWITAASISKQDLNTLFKFMVYIYSMKKIPSTC